MLRSTSEIIGYRIQATDGELGPVDDLYFDDQEWTIRYMVVDTGKWLPGRRVLISPLAAATPDWEKRVVPVSFTREWVKDSPSIDLDRPVSRQHEAELADYYKWAAYWGPGGVPPAPEKAENGGPDSQTEGDPHLRSVKEVLGYGIQATLEEVGYVEDFIAETVSWVLRYMVLDTRKWLPGRKVLIPPQWISRVEWDARRVRLDIAPEAIRTSPEFDPSIPINREYEVRLYDYHGRPYYW
jgi:hypothetical protein